MTNLVGILRGGVTLAAVTSLVTVLPPPIAHASDDGPQGVISAYSLAAPANEARSGLVSRAVVPAGAPCPLLEVTVVSHGKATPRSVVMSPRATPANTSPAFDSISVCAARIPVNSTAASIAGRRIPSAMPSIVNRLALLGDSGCRISSSQVQDCASDTEWPLARISQSIAQEHPDAVVFNGDFFYREAACPIASQAECGSSPPPVTDLPFTDSAYGWISDVLLPMAPVLSTAPLIVTRGNHEMCNRGGNGYFLLFDPRTGTEGTCAPSLANGTLTAAATTPTDTYAIDLRVARSRLLRLAIVDSAGGSDTHADSYAGVQRPAYESAAAMTRPRRGMESWLVSHRPVFGYVTTDFAQPGIPFNPWTSVDQTAASFGLLGNYALVFSSHLHLAQAVQVPDQPGQLVIGNSGTLLDPATGYPLPATGPTGAAGQQYSAPSSAWVAVRFGYAIATPNAAVGSWRIRMKDASGVDFARCGVAQRQIYCRDLSR